MTISKVAAAFRELAKDDAPPRWTVRVVSEAAIRECLSNAHTAGEAVDEVLADSEAEMVSVKVRQNIMHTRWKESQR